MVNISVGEVLAAKIQAGQTCIVVPYNHMALLYPGAQPGFNLKLYGWVDGDPRRFLGEAHTTGRIRRIVITPYRVLAGFDGVEQIGPIVQHRIARTSGFESMDHLRRFYHVTEAKPFNGLVITFKLKPVNYVR